MSLQIEITKHLKEAMKAKDTVSLEALRAIKSALLLLQTEQVGKDISSSEEMKILQKLAKQRKDSAQLYKEQNRKDLAKTELLQLEVIEQFLPKQLSEDEINDIVLDVISNQGASSMKDMGKIMEIVSSKLAGKADGKIISEIIKKQLS